ncbi:FAD-binding and BBE domain-containing protein [Hibiscus syriacus]|uniref:FAD-binding and BBE domain-containing protein n=1 Tax=Hibiscus syriacus TaxID=106335 RepID=A0A6A2ZV39_HIBSY|nr:FAD-binding and BBE domain-containing protein [Hibiscus syriacus]
MPYWFPAIPLSNLFTSRANNLRILSSATSRPVAIITALHPSHAQATVICAKRHDMFNLNSIDIDMKTKTAWIQAGATTGELYYRIAEQAKSMGSHLVFAPLLASVDILVEVAMGIHNRRSMGEDVFWAIRGGGTTSFGIILAWRVKLVRVPPKVTVFTVQRTLDQGATELAFRWQQVAPKLPKNLFVRLQSVPVNNGGNNKTIRAGDVVGSDDRHRTHNCTTEPLRWEDGRFRRETSFAHRGGNLFMAQYMVYWTQSDGGIHAAGRYVELSRGLYSAMAPYASGTPEKRSSTTGISTSAATKAERLISRSPRNTGLSISGTIS